MSITATHPFVANIRLSPQVEEEIKAAVLEATLAQANSHNNVVDDDDDDNNNNNNNNNNDHNGDLKDEKERRGAAAYGGCGGGSRRRKMKTKKNKKAHRRAPDGRRESPQTTRNWLIAKKVLRWVSLTICAMMVVGETVLAIFDGAYADTALGICLVRLILILKYFLPVLIAALLSLPLYPFFSCPLRPSPPPTFPPS